MPTKSKTLQFYQDPGHGWLKVPRRELQKYGIEHQVSSYSYQRGDHVYLEEDCDAGLYIRALKNEGYEVKFKDHHSNKQSKIRGYDYFKPSQEASQNSEASTQAEKPAFWSVL